MAERSCPGNKVWCGTDCVGYIQQFMSKHNLFFEDQTPRQEDEVKKRREGRSAYLQFLQNKMMMGGG